MRRQTHDVGLATRWVASPLDVDPRMLPAQVALPVRGRPGRPARDRDTVLISCDCIALERNGQIETHEIEDFSGVSVRMEGSELGSYAVSINLHHEDPDLCIPLHVAYDMDEAGARWQSWARTLGLPLLLPSEDGGWREPFARLGKVTVKTPWAREARLALANRRSAFSSRRAMGERGAQPLRGGREIIARH